jgi:hypothetical protein
VKNENGHRRFLNPPRRHRQGCEIRDPEGRIIAWAVDEPRALMIAALLNRIEAEGVGSLFKMQQRFLEEKTTP